MSLKALWLSFGLLAAAFGVAGVVLPLVPATPFLLLAAFAFGRSSPRLHRWLVTHPRLGWLIDDWRRHRAISRRTKAVALILMATSLVVSVTAGVSEWMVLAQAIALAGAAAFVLSRPMAPRSLD